MTLPTSLQPIYPSRHCAQTRRYLQVFNQSILTDIVLRQRRYLQVFNQSILTDIVLRQRRYLQVFNQSILTDIVLRQRRYLQVFNQSILTDIVLRQRRYLQVFNQSILTDIVLRHDVTYKSSTNLSLQTSCSDMTLPTSLQPIYPSRHLRQRRYLQVFNQSILLDISDKDVTYKSSTNLSFQTLYSDKTLPTSF